MTFGFLPDERARGVVDVPAIRDVLVARADALPVRDLTGYLEIGGPKLGRDYSDPDVEEALRGSIRYLRRAFVEGTTGADAAQEPSRTEEPIQIGGARAPVEWQAAEASDAPRVLVAPSVMCADLCHLESQIRVLERAGADMWHFDLMDFHFAPNMPLGLAVLEQMRPHTALPVDVHLMVENNDELVRELARIGVEQISVHAESAVHLDRTLNLIRGFGIRAGVALNPATPLDALEFVAESIDFVLLMTVNPGFAGQKLVPSAFRKIRACREKLAGLGRPVPIEVDGNVSFAHIPEMVACGAGMLVAGTSSVFSRDGSLAENFRRTRESIAAGLARRTGARVLEEVCA
jgi:ribulose-phosphate 3-epimerase